MNKLLTTLFALALLSAFTGCSSKSVEDFARDNNLSMSTNQSEINECFEWQREKESADRAQYDNLKVEERAFALMHKETMRMVTSVWGRGSNVCKPGTNGWDAYIAIRTEEEKTKRQYSSDFTGVAKFGIVTTGAVKLTDAVLGAAGDRIAGDKYVAGGDNKRASGDMIDSSVNERREENSSQVQVTSDGDATQGSAVDRSTTELPPEAPEAPTEEEGEGEEEVEEETRGPGTVELIEIPDPAV
jgi:hypothetical protein